MAINKKNLYIVAIIIIIAPIYLFTVRDGHNWGGDFSLYIRHAMNIANGEPYDLTGYIYNPNAPHVSPKTYPPMFPILLAPVYKLYGLNLNMFKYEIILFWVASMILLFMIFQRELPAFLSFAAVLTIGLNPWFLEFKNNVLSDIPFLFFCYAALLSIMLMDAFPDNSKKKTFYSILSGLLVYVAYLTRIAGIVFIPSLLFRDIITRRSISLSSLIVCCTTFLLIVTQKLIFFSDNSYFDQLSKSIPQFVKTFIHGASYYAVNLSYLWSNGHSVKLSVSIFIILSLFALIGLIRHIQIGISIFELFFAFYLVIIFSWPTLDGARFLIPIIPIFVFYIFFFLNSLTNNKFKAILAISTIAIVCLTYIFQYQTLSYGAIQNGITEPNATQMFEYVKNSTVVDDIFIFRKPRIFVLMTNRHASAYHEPDNDNALWSYFDSIHAKYLVHDIKRDSVFIRGFIDRNSDLLLPVYRNDLFIVYEFKNLRGH
jgi:hypothetical protein